MKIPEAPVDGSSQRESQRGVSSTEVAEDRCERCPFSVQQSTDQPMFEETSQGQGKKQPEVLETLHLVLTQGWEKMLAATNQYGKP